MPYHNTNTRRDFLRKMAATTALSAVGTTLLGGNTYALHRTAKAPSRVAPNDRVRIATIGMGIIGFIDTDTALMVPGVELVAAADTYASRRERVQEVYGRHVAVYTDYRELLARDDVDAVLICTPDHLHAPMSIDAMRAKKAVYCEKPMTRTVDEGPEVIKVAGETKAVFQVGSQYASSILYEKTRDLIAAGEIGELNSVEARLNRNSSIGAWQYSIPLDATPETVDWDRFLGNAPKRPFDKTRYFRWRNYWDYGTAVAGDLYVHLFTGIHLATGALGPDRVVAMGGLRYWDDGRDVYDVIMGLLNYPKTDAHPGFTVSLQTNFVDGGGGGEYFRFVGSEGTITAGWTELVVSKVGIVDAHEHTAEQVLHGYNSVVTWSAAQQAAFAEDWHRSRPSPAFKPPLGGEQRFVVPTGYDSRLDHFVNFFNSVRDGAPVFEDAAFGHRAAAPALLCNDSYRANKVLTWDPVNMKVGG